MQVPRVCKSWLAAAQVIEIVSPVRLHIHLFDLFNLFICQAPSLHQHAFMDMPWKTNVTTLIQVTIR